jgi:hypothetical protein
MELVLSVDVPLVTVVIITTLEQVPEEVLSRTMGLQRLLFFTFYLLDAVSIVKNPLNPRYFFGFERDDEAELREVIGH